MPTDDTDLTALDLVALPDDEFERLVEHALAHPAKRIPFRAPEVAPRAAGTLHSMQNSTQKKLAKAKGKTGSNSPEALTERSRRIATWRREISAVLEALYPSTESIRRCAEKIVGQAYYEEALKPVMRDLEGGMDKEQAYEALLHRLGRRD